MAESRPRIATGLSSGSCPAATAEEMAQLTRALGGSIVDLRAGKGHGWERDGMEPFRESGLEVAFLGLGLTLGQDSLDDLTQAELTYLEQASSVKVFCHRDALGSDRLPLVRSALTDLATRLGSRSCVLVETHHGSARVPDLIRLGAGEGVGVILDSLGLIGISTDPLADAQQLAPLVRFAQVKGFGRRGDGQTRHRPLEEDHVFHRQLLRVLPALEGVTVESRSGTLDADMRDLTAMLQEDGASR